MDKLPNTRKTALTNMSRKMYSSDVMIKKSFLNHAPSPLCKSQILEHSIMHVDSNYAGSEKVRESR